MLVGLKLSFEGPVRRLKCFLLLIDPGMTVQLTVNNGNSTLTPANGMLASIDDITTICTSGNCVADASNVPLGNSTRNFAIITVSQQTAGASVTFYKASFFYPTHRSKLVIVSEV
jgi:hypothetical protein